MKKGLRIFTVISLILILSLSFFLIAGKGGEEGSQKSEKKFMVGMATDVGGLGDKSFNDGCYEGLLKAKENLGVETRVVESKQQTDYVPNLTGLAEDGCNLVFAVGFLMADAIVEAAKNNPDTYFAGIDIWLNPDTAPKNAVGILFKEQESGYIAGVLAGLLTKKYAYISDKLNDENVVGMVLGMDIPPVERYQAGFYAGVKSVNPDCKVISIVSGSFVDQAKGKEATIALIEQGADIVFQIAGLTGLGVINAAKENNILAIGVDVDQNYLAPDTVVTSAIKGITQATYLVIKSLLDGNFKAGQNLTFGINDGATGISPYHNFDSIIPQEVKDIVNKTIEDMKAGKIKVPATRKEAGYEG